MCTAQGTAQFGLGLDMAATVGSVMASSRGASIERAVAQNNATLADWQAKAAIERGGSQELQLRRQAAKVAGRQQAALAAGGVDTSTGSALDILDETARSTEADAAVIRGNAAREAAARRIEASGYRARAAGYDQTLAGATSLITGAGRVADRWYQYQSEFG